MNELKEGFVFDATVSGNKDFIDRVGELLKLCMSLNDFYLTNTILVAVIENIESHIYDPGCMDMMKRIIKNMSLKKARCIGKDLVGIIYGKIYDVISVEDGWCRVFFEFDEKTFSHQACLKLLVNKETGTIEMGL